jgi:hypothetical protein
MKINPLLFPLMPSTLESYSCLTGNGVSLSCSQMSATDTDIKPDESLPEHTTLLL